MFTVATLKGKHLHKSAVRLRVDDDTAVEVNSATKWLKRTHRMAAIKDAEKNSAVHSKQTGDSDPI